MRWVIMAALIFLTGCAGTFNNGLFLKTGADYSGSANPICGDRENGNHYGKNDAVTSSLGVRYEAYKSKNDMFRANLNFLHHSCIFNDDRKNYDGFGFDLEWRLF